MRVGATVLVLLLYLLHQDLWFWHEARPLVFGVFPVGLFYHVAFVAASALVLSGLVTFLWPEQLENTTAERE